MKKPSNSYPVALPKDLQRGDVLVDDIGNRHIVAGDYKSDHPVYMTDSANGDLFVWTEGDGQPLHNWRMCGRWRWTNSVVGEKGKQRFIVRVERRSHSTAPPEFTENVIQLAPPRELSLLLKERATLLGESILPLLAQGRTVEVTMLQDTINIRVVDTRPA